MARKAPSWGGWFVAYSAGKCHCSDHTAAQGGMHHHHCTSRLWGPWAVASANQPPESHQWVPIMTRKAPSWGGWLVEYSTGERGCSDHTAAQGVMHHHHCTPRLWGPWAAATANQPAEGHQWVPIITRKAPSWGGWFVAYSAGERRCSAHTAAQGVIHHHHCTSRLWGP